MAKGFSGMPGGMNMGNLMKQAQKMQKQMEEAQKSLSEKMIETSSGGGAIKVKVSGNKEIKEIILDKDVVDPDDIEMLQDLIVAAVNEALRQVEEVHQSEMSKVTGGMGLPGGMF